MSNLKLGVEVVSAHDLMAKDGQGSSNTFVELHFDGQRFRTATKEKDLNPVWNERFYFNVSDPNILSNLTLDAYIYNLNKANNSKSFLGKVRLTGTSFVPYSDAVVLHYPLEKRSFLSRVKGELGLKVFVTDDPSIKSSNPLPAMESSLHTGSDSIQSQEPVEHVQKFLPNLFSNEKSRARHTFNHLPNASPAQPLQQNIPSMVTQSTVNYGMQEMKSQPQVPKVFQMYSGSSSQSADYTVRETSPHLGGGQIVHGRVIRGDRPVSTYDLVEQMQYLFVRVVKARDLPSKDVTGSLDPFVEVKVGNFKGITKHFEKKQNPEWNEVFAFAKDNVASSFLEVVVKDKDMIKDDFVGLEDKKGEKTKGELMLAVWNGTQADEAFPDAWHSDAYTSNDSSSTISSHTRSKVYHSPRLWYVRVNIIEAQDLVVSDKSRFPDAYVKVQIGNQLLKTKSTQVRSLNAVWREEFLLVASEPFEELLVLSVEDRLGPTKEETIGKVVIPLNMVERRADDRFIRSRWFNIEKSVSAAMDGDHAKKEKFSSKLHLSVCLDGGYHVLDEPTHYSSDLRPTAKQLWKPSIGVLELGILNADGLHPIKTREEKGTADTYCVAKYGHKWVRTRTIMNSLSPKYNEQYTWEVYDPATVITVGVFDDSHIGGSNDHKDSKVGKVRIRISTLETGRVYTHSYPLLVLHPSGVKKMGELHLAIRFSCTSLMNMMMIYSRPVLPKMHYIRPLSVMQQDWLRHQAVSIVAARLGRAEPPLRREVVEYMSDAHSHLWSMRRSKANFFRVMSVFSGLLAVGKWFGDVCMWKNPITAVLVHVLFVMLVCFPELILPTVFLYLVVIGFWNLRFRPKDPPHMNTKISYADSAHPDELDEEFDPFPSQRGPDIVRARYDRLRIVAGKIQNVVGDMASQLERVQALLSWRDTRATIIFVLFCFVSAIVLYVTPFQVIVLLAGFYIMRHPRFRRRTPAAPLNFFRRLPARTDIML
ncbi:hypothetical protein I3843_01G055100 [Carya illinoinensis]|uniref:C2 domain-containing protein n=1 Tax=Carya illinoinensis TaxID=32201 RepID=A0A922FWS6_CARIL|nr:hypothetical protein I3842_01G056100 [Carya illinoinensis]KAG7994369.1 hypothetical protein I3843_01G055100 [Carya illinoinensis]